MRTWVTAGILSLQATLSQAAELPSPVTHADFPETRFSEILLGRDLFFDPVLSGNRDLSCAGCHHPASEQAHRSADRRLAPPLFNRGAIQVTTLHHPARVTMNPRARMGVAMPENATLERPVPHALAALPLVALTDPAAMAGAPGENGIADLVAQGRLRGPGGAWQAITARIEAIPAYRRRFDPLIGPDEPLHITDISTAIAAFIAYEYRSINSPFDAYLSGRTAALTPPQKRGLVLFFGKAACAECHSGPFFTDRQMHVFGVAPRRTPGLRNVTLSWPQGLRGADDSLATGLRRHLSRLGNQPAPDLRPSPLADAEIADLIHFLGALSDPQAMTGRLGAPAQVPSGLPIDPVAAPATD